MLSGAVRRHQEGWVSAVVSCPTTRMGGRHLRSLAVDVVGARTASSSRRPEPIADVPGGPA